MARKASYSTTTEDTSRASFFYYYYVISHRGHSLRHLGAKVGYFVTNKKQCNFKFAACYRYTMKYLFY